MGADGWLNQWHEGSDPAEASSLANLIYGQWPQAALEQPSLASQPPGHAGAIDAQPEPGRQCQSQAHAAAQVNAPWHANVPSQSMLHAPLPQLTLAAQLWAPTHATMQCFASPQVSSLQAPVPAQAMLQLSAWSQLSPARQEFCPVQFSVQERALPQRTGEVQLPSRSQWTMQSKPAGQGPTLPSAAGSISQPAAVQPRVHAGGQPAAPASSDPALPPLSVPDSAPDPSELPPPPSTARLSPTV